MDVGFGGAGDDGHAAGGLVDHHLGDAAALGRGEAGELAGGAVGVQAMHAALDEPVNVAAHFGFVDLAVLVHGDQQRGVNAFNLFLFRFAHD